MKDEAATDPEFEPAAPGSWTCAGQTLSTASHEAAHAVVARWWGIKVRSARIDRPVYETAGEVLIELPAGYMELGHFCTVLAGPVAVGQCPTWPLDENAGGDERILARLSARMEYSHEDWRKAVSLTKTLLEHPSVRRACKALGTALLKCGAIPGHEVHRIVDEALHTPAHTTVEGPASFRGC